MAVVIIVGVITRMRVVMIGINILIAPKILERFGAEQASDERAQQWQEENCLNHVPQPFIKLISSTAIVPRLRK